MRGSTDVNPSQGIARLSLFLSLSYHLGIKLLHFGDVFLSMHNGSGSAIAI